MEKKMETTIVYCCDIASYRDNGKENGHYYRGFRVIPYKYQEPVRPWLMGGACPVVADFPSAPKATLLRRGGLRWCTCLGCC